MIFGIAGLDVAGTTWVDEVSYLTTYLRQHVKDEEHTFFPHAQRAGSGAD
jgi:hypothetical protein